jgi:hypothetical protein
MRCRAAAAGATEANGATSRSSVAVVPEPQRRCSIHTDWRSSQNELSLPRPAITSRATVVRTIVRTGRSVWLPSGNGRALVMTPPFPGFHCRDPLMRKRKPHLGLPSPFRLPVKDVASGDCHGAVMASTCDPRRLVGGSRRQSTHWPLSTAYPDSAEDCGVGEQPEPPGPCRAVSPRRLLPHPATTNRGCRHFARRGSQLGDQ